MQTMTTFYMGATPRPGTEDSFQDAVRRLAGKEFIDGLRLAVLELDGNNAALRGEMPAESCPECPEALATYLEDQLAAKEHVYFDLDVHIA